MSDTSSRDRTASRVRIRGDQYVSRDGIRGSGEIARQLADLDQEAAGFVPAGPWENGIRHYVIDEALAAVADEATAYREYRDAWSYKAALGTISGNPMCLEQWQPVKAAPFAPTPAQREAARVRAQGEADKADLERERAISKLVADQRRHERKSY